MRTQLSCGAIALLVLGAGQVRAQSPAGTPAAGPVVIQLSPFAGAKNPLTEPAFLTGQDKGKEQEKDKDKEKEPKGKTQPPVEPQFDAFAQTAPESAEASRGLNP